MKATFEASVYLLHETLLKLKGTTEIFMTLLISVVKLVLERAGAIQAHENMKDLILSSLSEECITLGKYVNDSIGGALSRNHEQAMNEIKVLYVIVL